MNEYEVILSEHGFLTNHNMRFDNHRLVPGNEFPISIEKTINKIYFMPNMVKTQQIYSNHT